MLYTSRPTVKHSNTTRTKNNAIIKQVTVVYRPAVKVNRARKRAIRVRGIILVRNRVVSPVILKL